MSGSFEPAEDQVPRGAVGRLFDAVQRECSEVDWSRGVNLSRGGSLTARRVGSDEIEARVTTSGGGFTPRVTLSPEHADWDCECQSAQAACPHVAAAVILLRRRDTSGDGDVRVAPRLGYELLRAGGALQLCVVLVQGQAREPIQVSLAAIQKRLGAERLVVSPVDRVIDGLLRGSRAGPILRPLMIPLLAALAEVDGVHLDGEPVTFGEAAYILSVRLEGAGPGHFKLIARDMGGVSEHFTNGAAIRDGVLFAIRPTGLSENDLDALKAGRVYGPQEVHALVSRILPGLRSRVAVDVRARRLPKLTSMQPRLVFSVQREGGELVATPQLVYGDPVCGRLDGDRITHLGGALPERDQAAERRLGSRLRSELGMHFGHPRRASGEEALALAQRLRAFGAPVEGDGLEQTFVAPALTPELEVEGPDARLTFRSEHEGRTLWASAADVLDAWRAGSRLVPLDTGGWAPLPEDFLTRHGHLVADLLAASEALGRLPRSVGADVARLCEALDRPATPDLEALRRLSEGFEGVPECELPADLRGTLRDYQREGVRWLMFLSRAGLGALLADDMGLGKTLQAACALGSPALVVCPSSVLHAWHDELARFRPGLTVRHYHGPERSLDPGADVTLTTYAILRRDADPLAAWRWDTVVLDEAQVIKNPLSQVARAACALTARFRMVLTGTPIENRLEDLWSEMHFLNPGLLSGLSEFRERYARPVAAGDPEAARRLRQRVRPFVLRRAKGEVARELPPRTDVLLRCSLDEEERAAYDAVRAATREEVVRELSAGRGVMAALEALLRLRQACCHTGLLPGREAASSSKTRLLMETLEEAMAAGHRALVFSQWTSLLDLVEPHLEEREVAFLRLDGATRDRRGVVEAFQSDEGPPVMLISLKAGGVGLTLTAADHVFLLDPWWNPAVEDQAADRIHRIGQEHPVLVHRIVAEDTVEEGLLALQERKRALSAAALAGGAASGAGLTREDLLSLLS